jgi:DNA polymerase-3 subunit delta'
MFTFHDIIGQEKIVDHLRTAVTTGQISHAYIIAGERGMGKEFIANVFAMAVQCENRTDENPCGECHSCKQALAGVHPDIIFVKHEKPGLAARDRKSTRLNSSHI